LYFILNKTNINKQIIEQSWSGWTFVCIE